MTHVMQTMKRAAIIFALAALPFAFALPVQAAVDIDEGLSDVQSEAGYANTDLETALGSLISVVLGFLGIILLLIIIYSGFLWMTAGGDTGKVDKAKDWMKNSIIGLIIILAAYALTGFVITALQNAGF